ncbi:MAG: RNA-binding transcriptional accessory protein [Rhodobacteraceae bacterium]|nr:RNA-binding transcriptional accessory protein [Paracoccaceae bacterium]
MTAPQITARIATDISARADQVSAAIKLLDDGATVPFIARYRKEVTGGLDDAQLRLLADRLVYLREMEERRAVIVKSITEQGKLDDALARAIAAADTKAALEDLYLPYKPKRRSKAMIARENGLEPLLDAILNDRGDPEALAGGFLSDAVADTKSALTGARDILAERLSEDAVLLGRLRDHLRANGRLVASVIDGKEAEGAKYSDYFAHSEPLKGCPGHRALAMFRGRNEGVLALDITLQDPDAAARMVRAVVGIRGEGAADNWLAASCDWCWRIKLKLSLTIDLMTELRERAEQEAISVFARNLTALLLAAPAGARVTLAIDPGIRTGCKLAVIDATGKLLDTATIYPFQPKNDLRGAQATLGALIARHGVELIAIGNGTASRESERMVADLLIQIPAPRRPQKLVVSEAGASVYSASALASAEFPDLDVSLRGAVSIARRLQDPLAELVKIDPKSIGVGQYQHDVNQTRLARALDAVVEDAVNAVGVDLNTASAPLLARVSGLGQTLAEAIVAHRNANGPFAARKALLTVPRLGPKAFEQCAGFLRIRDGAEPLDGSAVHPEAYALARRIVKATGKDLRALMSAPSVLRSLEPADFVDDRFGLPTVRDILAELEKPGRDPRPEFRTACFADGVESIGDLRPGMSLEGTVTNVAAFGAFVDIGVHQDGLVHVSQLADRFVKDPHEVVKTGDIVRVRVTEVDATRKRIGLSMRKGAAPDAPAGGRGEKAKPAPRKPDARGARPDHGGRDALGGLGAALQDALRKR